MEISTRIGVVQAIASSIGRPQGRPFEHPAI
jgi:hypothetical protein